MTQECTAYLPILFQGHKVADLTVHVRANYDEAFKYDMAMDVFFEDDTGKRHAANDLTARMIAERIKNELPDTWREIQEAAEEDYLEGCDPDPDRIPQFDAINMGLR